MATKIKLTRDQKQALAAYEHRLRVDTGNHQIIRDGGSEMTRQFEVAMCLRAAAELIRASAGRFFSCTFTKADGSVRHMRCRYAEARHVATHNPLSDERITVFDDEAQAYRTIPLTRLQELRIDGHTIEVTK